MSPYLALLPWAAIPVLMIVGELRANPPKVRPEFVENAAIVLGLAGIVIVGAGRIAGVIA